jgi:glycosyltransferase involved in cell wall biosynthesis
MKFIGHIAMLLTNPFRPDPRVLKEARSLVQAGYRVTVICWDRRGELPPHEVVDGIEIRRLAVRSGYSAGSRQALYLPRFWRQALRVLAEVKPDVIHCHDLDTTPAGWWFSRRHHLPWIYDAHECYPEQIGPQVSRVLYRLLLRLERFMVPRASLVITVGETLAGHFRDLGAKAVAVVANYPAPEDVSPVGMAAPSRVCLGIPGDALLVGYIGGFTLAREILPLLTAVSMTEGVHLLLAGDGPQRAAIEAVLPAHPRVHYLGWLSQAAIPAHMALVDVVYYGLRVGDGNARYSAPNALFGAMAAGKPLLVTDVGEVGRIVHEEQCGVTVERAEPRLLAAGIEPFRDPNFRRDCGRRGAAAAASQYNWEAAACELIAQCRKLLPRIGE